jgi:hypothetical protein
MLDRIQSGSRKLNLYLQSYKYLHSVKKTRQRQPGRRGLSKQRVSNRRPSLTESIDDTLAHWAKHHDTTEAAIAGWIIADLQQRPLPPHVTSLPAVLASRLANYADRTEPANSVTADDSAVLKSLTRRDCPECHGDGWIGHDPVIPCGCQNQTPNGDPPT